MCGVRLFVHKDDKETQKAYEELGLNKTKYRLFEETFKKKSGAPKEFESLTSGTAFD